MLLEFSCKNHKSIKNEVLFSLLASKDTFNDEYLYDYKDLKILKSSVVYGANGSGKSNLLEAISLVLDTLFGLQVKTPIGN
ncbi:AAA family ATPase, partial [Holdemanella biformis]|uniref:AAA family ATPase n=1 Tax=Holdemanella biformis TaxID=1735 RepID=UPI00402949C0